METLKKKPLLIGLPGATVTDEDEANLRMIAPQGIILFSRNYQNIKQVQRLTQNIRSILGDDVIIAVDHEGGRVVRFHDGLPNLPSPHVLGKNKNPEKIRKSTRETAYILHDLGVTLNLAPVLDVATPYTHSSMRERCFDNDPESVADLGTAFIEGMHEGGLKCAAKHFPGLGPGGTIPMN